MNRARTKWFSLLVVAQLFSGCSDNVLFLGSDIMDGGDSENHDTGFLDTASEVESEPVDTSSDDDWETDEESDVDSEPEEDAGDDRDTSEDTDPEED